jgi:hypothetical protein
MTLQNVSLRLHSMELRVLELRPFSEWPDSQLRPKRQDHLEAFRTSSHQNASPFGGLQTICPLETVPVTLGLRASVCRETSLYCPARHVLTLLSISQNALILMDASEIKDKVPELCAALVRCRSVSSCAICDGAHQVLITPVETLGWSLSAKMHTIKLITCSSSVCMSER